MNISYSISKATNSQRTTPLHKLLEKYHATPLLPQTWTDPGRFSNPDLRMEQHATQKHQKFASSTSLQSPLFFMDRTS